MGERGGRLMDKEQTAIARLQAASEMSLQFYKTPLVVTTSGGKDSTVCVALAERAGIPFEVIHNHTTVDAPEMVYFVREDFRRLEGKGVKCTVNFPVYKGQRVTMWSLIPQKLMPPTRVGDMIEKSAEHEEMEAAVTRLKELQKEGTIIAQELEQAENALNEARDAGAWFTMSEENSVKALTAAQEENAAQIAELEAATADYMAQQEATAQKTQEATRTVDGLISEMNKLQEAYNESYNAAMESIDGQVCWQYLQADQLLPVAKREVAKALAEANNEKEIVSLKAKIDSLAAHLDKVYMDKLSGVLDESDFQRIYAKVKADRAALEQRLSQLDRPDYSPAEQVDLAKKLVERFLETASTNRELLVSLIERVELTTDKQIIIKFRFEQLETA